MHGRNLCLHCSREMAAVEFKSKSAPKNKNSTVIVDAAAKHSPTTVGEAFRDYLGRRAALIKALTTDIKKFLRQCDPGYTLKDKDDALCLYGLPDGNWKVGPPIEDLPSTMQEPTVGINLGRINLQRNNWLSVLASHCDAWLLSLALHNSKRPYLHKPNRQRLFNMINGLPTVTESMGRSFTAEELKLKSACRKCTVVEAEATPVARQGPTVEEVFRDFAGRRAGIIRALTIEIEELLRQCDPDKSELCLYGHPDGRWEVAPPTQEVCQTPEPTVGINFRRVGISQSEWLLFVAVHSDAWLISMAFYNYSQGSFHKVDRQRLFDMINELATVAETMGEMRKAERGKSEEEDDSLCVVCAEKYEEGELWICCYYCEMSWYHGECVGVSPAQAERIDKFRCPEIRRCRQKRESRVPRR